MELLLTKKKGSGTAVELKKAGSSLVSVMGSTLGCFQAGPVALAACLFSLVSPVPSVPDCDFFYK